MGSGTWSANSHFDATEARRRAGVDTFAYSAAAKQSGVLRVHQTLDPQGLKLRESRDGPDHPESNAILISLDVTGSMGAVVRGIHRNLPHLHELLLGHKYVTDPQILFGAVGDATCDQVPLQIGQFESDNRMDQHLENMILEGGGGGQQTESYELMLYLAARHTAIDCHEKRGRKGYLFVIGDETAYPAVKRAHVRRLVGTDPERDVPLEEIVAEVQAKYHLYFVIPGGASNGNDKAILGFWQQLIGPQHVLQLDDPDDTSECIAMTIGLNEGVISLPEAQEQLRRRGVVRKAVDRILGALGGLFGGGGPPQPPAATSGRRL